MVSKVTFQKMFYYIFAGSVECLFEEDDPSSRYGIKGGTRYFIPS